MRQFRARKTFHSPELESTYVEGLIYTIRDGNDTLARAAFVWEEDGRIEWIVPTARIGGAGTVA